MMTVQLLLLLALVGPFCSFTYASPTVIPMEWHSDTPTAVKLNVTEEQDPNVTDLPPTTPVVEITEVMHEDFTTNQILEASTSIQLETVEPTSGSHTSIGPKITVTDHQFVVPTVPPTKALEPAATDTNKEEISEEGEESNHEGLTSGQVVGIVIGSLLTVVFLVAVVIAVLRRMGKYSP